MEFKNVVSTALLMLSAVLAGAQTYPTQNPTYIPNAQGPATSFTAATITAAATDYYFACNGVGGATVSVEGTLVGFSAVLQVTNDAGPFTQSSTWTSSSVRLIGGGARGNLATITAAGLYRANCNGFTALDLHMTALTSGTAKIRIVATPANDNVVTSYNGADPCLDPNTVKSSVAIAIATATTTSLVAVSGTTAVYVCSLTATVGASSTLSLEYGTSTGCTGTHAMTGVYTPATGGAITVPELAVTPASQGVCAVTTGTGGQNGVMTYVQE